MQRENSTNESTTIYQFGLNEIDGKFQGYAYRSTNNYFSEEMTYSIGIKPRYAFSTDEEISKFIEGNIGQDVISSLMLKLKEYDDNLGSIHPDKVGIGGQMEICILQKGYLQISIKDIFPDCASVYQEILSNCSS